MDNWIYSNSNENRERYLLGEKGVNTLVCVGINPSTAVPEKLDNTLSNVKSRSKLLGYDSWLMLNVYPQRSTDPNNLHKTMDKTIHQRNLHEIKNFFTDSNYDIWAAWGTLIEKRSYLYECLKDIYSVIGQNSSWYSIGNKTKKGHPHHPLYLRKDLPLQDFDMDHYLFKRK